MSLVGAGTDQVRLICRADIRDSFLASQGSPRSLAERVGSRRERGPSAKETAGETFPSSFPLVISAATTNK